MGTTFSSIHIFSNDMIETRYCELKSFSDGWHTCVTDLSDKDPEYVIKLAKLISKAISAPVLYFYIFDSEYIHFEFLKNGKTVSRFSDYAYSNNKNIYGIPAMVGYGEGHKKRLSNILACEDADEKTELLEEYFGVCLLPFSESLFDGTDLKREKNTVLYDAFTERKKAVSGKNTPISAELVAEYKGKIFYCDFFAPRTKKEHCYLLGYETEKHELRPVRFCGAQLMPISEEEFNRDRVPEGYERGFCEIEYGSTCYAVFNGRAPTAFANKRLKMPKELYPLGFDTKNRLVLSGKRQICVADENMNIIAKCPVKGDCDDMIGDYILSTSGDSFCGYEYDPKAAVRIYRLVEKIST